MRESQGLDQGREQKKEVLLIPIGKVLVDVLGEIAVALRKSYSYHVRIGRSEEPANESYSDERRQYDAEKLMPLVASRKREYLVAVLGVVDADMFAGEKSFVFGQCLDGKGSAVIALSRLREEYYKKSPKTELFMRRAVSEAIYQVGRAMGLPACPQKQCIMSTAPTLWRLDEKAQGFCEVSSAQLGVKLGRFAPVAKESGAGLLKEVIEDAGTKVNSLQAPADTGHQVGPVEAEDEAQVDEKLVEPEAPQPAEEAAVHAEASGPEEPLVADAEPTERQS